MWKRWTSIDPRRAPLLVLQYLRRIAKQTHTLLPFPLPAQNLAVPRSPWCHVVTLLAQRSLSVCVPTCSHVNIKDLLDPIIFFLTYLFHFCHFFCKRRPSFRTFLKVFWCSNICPLQIVVLTTIKLKTFADFSRWHYTVSRVVGL